MLGYVSSTKNGPELTIPVDARDRSAPVALVIGPCRMISALSAQPVYRYQRHRARGVRAARPSGYIPCALPRTLVPLRDCILRDGLGRRPRKLRFPRAHLFLLASCKDCLFTPSAVRYKHLHDNRPFPDAPRRLRLAPRSAHKPLLRPQRRRGVSTVPAKHTGAPYAGHRASGHCCG